MKTVRVGLRIIAYLMLIVILGFVTMFTLVTFNVIDNPYEEKVELINLSQSEIRVKRNNKFQLSADVYPKNLRNAQIKYKSDNPNIVEVNEITGYVSAKSNGIATITAYLVKNEKINSECKVIVSDNNVPINSISLNSKQIKIMVGNTYKLNYKFSPSNATLHDIYFLSSDESIATIDENGKIKGISEGQAIIKVIDKISGVNSETTVKVYPKTTKNPTTGKEETSEVKSITVSEKNISLTVDGSRKVNVTIKPSNANKEVTWQSLDDNIATVNNGIITGRKVGNTKVIATTVNGKEAYIDVKVVSKSISVTGIRVKNNNIKLDISKKVKIDYEIIPSNATNQGVTITSDNTDVAIVNSDYIGGVKEGQATVTIKTKDGGYEAQIKVTVNKPSGKIIDETDLNISKDVVNLKVGESETVTAQVLPANATYKTVKWQSMDTRVATVSNGFIVGVSKGNTEIVVSTANKNISKRIKVSVTDVSVSGIKLDKTSATLNLGETLSLVKTISPSNATNKNVTWTSSNSSVATVNSNGIVTTNGAGTAVITVTSAANSNIKATCTITVKNTSVAVTGVTLDKHSANTTVGDKVYINAQITPSNATNKTITWSSSDSSVARVSDGVVEALKAGTVVITATTNNGKTDKCTIKIEERKAESNKDNINNAIKLEFDSNKYKVKSGKNINLKSRLTINAPSGVKKDLTWEIVSGDKSLVTHEGDGYFKTNTNNKTGEVTIKVSLQGAYATCVIEVISSNSQEQPTQPSSSVYVISKATHGLKEGKGKQIAENNTTIINNALLDAQEKKYTDVRLEKGTYYVSNTIYKDEKGEEDKHFNHAISIPSNINLDLNKSEIKLFPNSNEWYSIVIFNQVSNSSITNGTITGDRAEHTCRDGITLIDDMDRQYGAWVTTGGNNNNERENGHPRKCNDWPDLSTADKRKKADGWNFGTHEWGMGINVSSSLNITIDNLTIKDGTGDGIYLYKKPLKSLRDNQNITIKNCTITNFRRQGISIIDANGLVIDNNNISKIYGTAPEAGIDFEPTHDKKQVLANIEIKNNNITPNVSVAAPTKDQKDKLGRGGAIDIYLREDFLSSNIHDISIDESNVLNRWDGKIRIAVQCHGNTKISSENRIVIAKKFNPNFNSCK